MTIVEQATSVAWLAAECESIGRNCEFGYYQRELGIEPVSLLRWAGAPTRGLLAGLTSEFDGLMEAASGISVGPPDDQEKQEWWLTCDRYQITFHSGQRVSETTVETATQRIRARQRWLAAKLLTDIRASEKILVYSSAEMHGAADALPLVDAIRRISFCPLLVAVQVDGADGIVHERWPGVWIAEMPRLTQPMGANGLDVPMWSRVLESFGRCFTVGSDG